MNNESRCTANNIKSHCIYFTWKFFFNSAVLDYNFHFMFNPPNQFRNSESTEGTYILNAVAVIVVYSYTLLQPYHLQF